ANRSRARRPGDLRAHDIAGTNRIVAVLMRDVRVHANGEPRLRPQRDQPFRLGPFIRISTLEDDQHAFDGGRSRTLDDCFQIRAKRGVRQVAVGIDHLTRVPGAGGSSNETNKGLPPSGLAASTIPFDSTPISLAGFKLNTMTTVRPNRLS